VGGGGGGGGGGRGGSGGGGGGGGDGGSGSVGGSGSRGGLEAMQVEAASDAAGLSAIVACVGVVEEMAIPQLESMLRDMLAQGQLRVSAADLQQLDFFRRAFTPEELSRIGGWADSAEGRIVPEHLPSSCMMWSDTERSPPVVCFRVPLELALVLARPLAPQVMICCSAIYLLRLAVCWGRLGVVKQLLASAPALLDDEFDQSILREPGTYDCEPLYIACSADGLPLDTRFEMVRTLVSAYRARATQQGVEGNIFYVINRGWRPSAEYRALQAARERGFDDIMRYLIESGVPFDSSAEPDPAARDKIDQILFPHRISMDTLNLNSGANVITDEKMLHARQLFGRNNAMAWGYLVGKLNLEDCAPPGGWGSLDPDEVKSRALRDAIDTEARLRDLRSRTLLAEQERLREDLLAEQLAYSTLRSAAADPKLLCFVCNPDNDPDVPSLKQALNDALAASQAIPAHIFGGTQYAKVGGKRTLQEAQTADRDCSFARLKEELSAKKPWYFLFSGHADVTGPCREKRLGFTNSEGQITSTEVDNDQVAELLARSQVRLVVLNGCESLELAKACIRKGVPAVVCWETVVPDEAAYLFVRGFFRKLAESQEDFARAFDAGKEAVVSKKLVHLTVVSGEVVTRTRSYFEFADPKDKDGNIICDFGVQGMLPSGSYAAGKPMLLTAEGERCWEYRGVGAAGPSGINRDQQQPPHYQQQDADLARAISNSEVQRYGDGSNM